MSEPCGLLAESMRMKVVSANTDSVVVKMPVAGNAQPFGVLHGGANAALIEEAGSRLALLNAPSGRVAVGTELNVSHLAPAHTGYVTATAHITKLSSSSLVSSVEIRNDAGDITAIGRITCVFLAAPR